MSLNLPNPFVKDPATQQNFDYLQRTLEPNGGSGTGTVGPQGPPGAAGADGAPGPAGEDGVDGADGADGLDALGIFFETKTLTIPDDVNIAVGEIDYNPPILVALNGTHQQAKIVKATFFTHADSVILSLQRNGVDLAGYTTVEATPVPATATADVVLEDGDLLGLSVVAKGGFPTNLTFGIVIEHTVPGRYYETRTFTVPDLIMSAVAEIDYIPPMVVGVGADQALKLTAIKAVIHSGTSVTLDLNQNGVPIIEDLVVTTTLTTTDIIDAPLADGDLIAPVITAIDGDPRNLSLGLVLEHSAA